MMYIRMQIGCYTYCIYFNVFPMHNLQQQMKGSVMEVQISKSGGETPGD